MFVPGSLWRCSQCGIPDRVHGDHETENLLEWILMGVWSCGSYRRFTIFVSNVFGGTWLSDLVANGSCSFRSRKSRRIGDLDAHIFLDIINQDGLRHGITILQFSVVLAMSSFFWYAGTGFQGFDLGDEIKDVESYGITSLCCAESRLCLWCTIVSQFTCNSPCCSISNCCWMSGWLYILLLDIDFSSLL